MELTHTSATVKASKTLRLYPVGDVHLGATACDINDFRRTVQMVAEDRDARWLGLGDMGDFIMPSDPRWNMDGHDWKRLGYHKGRPTSGNLAVEHVAFIRRELEPIRDKCLGLLDGNHEDAFRKHYFSDPMREIAEAFKVRHLGYTTLIQLDIAKRGRPDNLWTVNIFAKHGATGGGTIGNATNSIQRRAAEWEADVYLKGHVHQYGVTQKVALSYGERDGEPRIAKRDRLFMLTGTYLLGYQIGVQETTTYSERKGYPPSEIGGGVILFDLEERRIHGMSTAAYAAARKE